MKREEDEGEVFYFFRGFKGLGIGDRLSRDRLSRVMLGWVMLGMG